LFDPAYKITSNAVNNIINVDLSDEELSQRKEDWQMPDCKARHGMLYKYTKNVKSASEGCVTDE